MSKKIDVISNTITYQVRTNIESWRAMQFDVDHLTPPSLSQVNVQIATGIINTDRSSSSSSSSSSASRGLSRQQRNTGCEELKSYYRAKTAANEWTVPSTRPERYDRQRVPKSATPSTYVASPGVYYYHYVRKHKGSFDIT